jgi:acyl transferase domain-containing protein/thioesterase domain-containing protein
MVQTSRNEARNAIAIVGMAAHLPACRTIADYWRLLKEGRHATRWLSDEELLTAGVAAEDLADPNYVRAANVLPDMEMFDAEFFGFSPKEAAILDPQHRHFLELCWEVLEDAGHMPDRFEGAIGIFAGAGMQAYLPYNLLTNQELVKEVGLFLLRHTGNDKDFLTTRASYLLDLQGPSINIQTACSTSLVAVHQACQSLLSGECDMALAGGITIELPHRRGYHFRDGEILSPDGLCRAFDDDAAGTVFGSGGGIVALRRLEDALADGDEVRAVIRSTAVNNDGSQKAGYLAPSVHGQAGAAAEALAVAGIDPASVSYIEAHGTGTPIGDPIELAALKEAYDVGQGPHTCGLGSVKTNIGHLDTAAGAASLIKVVLALQNELLPPSLNFKKPSSRFDFASSPFHVVSKAQPWPRGAEPRRAAVNSLGVGGTNAHVIVEEAPLRSGADGAKRWHLLPISARSQASLDGLLDRWGRFSAEKPELPLADAAFTLQSGRKNFACRAALVAQDTEGLADALRSRNGKRIVRGTAGARAPEVVFMFPGGGAQYPGAGREFYEGASVFREAADACFVVLPRDAPRDLKAVMLAEGIAQDSAAATLERPSYAIPALFILEYAFARLWESWGIRPAAMIGHSAGEYVAACLAGILTLPDALAIVTLRGQLFEQVPEGSLLSVGLPEDDLAGLVGHDLDIAAVNGPSACVVSGTKEKIAALTDKLATQGIQTSRLRINVAAHSRLLDGVLGRFRELLERLDYGKPAIPCISNLRGGWAVGSDLGTAEYWVRHMRECVRFGDGIAACLDAPDRILLEVGPGQNLGALAQIASGRHEPLAVLASSAHAKEQESDAALALATAGALWCHGAAIDWTAIRGSRDARRVSLPTYAFERRSHWIEPGKGTAAAEASPDGHALTRIARREDWFFVPEWTELRLTAASTTAARRWLLFSDGSQTAAALEHRIETAGGVVIRVRPAGAGAGDADHAIDPYDWEACETLLRTLDDTGGIPDHIVSFWAMDEAAGRAGGLDSGWSLARALQSSGSSGWRLLFVTSGAQSVDGEAPTHPERATLTGIARVLPRECPGTTVQIVDLYDGDPERSATALFGEATGESTDDLIAWRGDKRMVQRLARTKVDAPEGLPARLREGGVYAITGGTGGIGLELAAWLARVARAKLALIARSPLPARKDWQRAIAAAPDSELAGKLKTLAALEDQGAELLVLQADVTSDEDMARVLSAVEERFGTLNGVVHAAGVIDDAPLAVKTRESIERVLAPKLHGVEVLNRLVPDGTLDFLMVFGSTSAFIGPPGQTDYVAANAGVAALAAARSDGLCVDWGVWSGVGIAARAYGRNLPAGSATGHPLLGTMERSSDGACFTARLVPTTSWVLDQHRINGRAVLPGTAYVEIIRAAMHMLGGTGALTITALSIHAALQFPGDEPRVVTTKLARNRDGAYDVEIASTSAWDSVETVHATASVCNAPGEAPSWTGALLASAGSDAPPAPIRHPLPPLLSWGKRWDCIEEVRSAQADHTLALLRLAAEFAPELDEFRAHPALLDLAATIGLQSLENGYGSSGLYAPVSAGTIHLFAPLSARLVCAARLVDAEIGRYALYDVAVADREGRLVAAIEGLALHRVPADAILEARAGEPPTLAEAMMRHGLKAEDAPEIFARIFDSRATRLTVSSMEIAQLRQAVARTLAPKRAAAAGRGHAAKGNYANAVESTLAGIWSDLLGIEGIGAEEDFFALGGHSLIAVRLFAQIKKLFGITLPLSTLFRAPTIAQLAALVAERTGVSPGATPEIQPEHRATAPAPRHLRDWSPLVTIRKGDPKRRPLFFVHGGGGNVVGCNTLAQCLGTDQTFYGLEALGADGSRVEPHRSVEEMAACYLEAIRTVQPKGPYLFAGYSGGGVIAYEMAQMLRKEKDSAELLLMLDTLCPTALRGQLSLAGIVKIFLLNPVCIRNVVRNFARYRANIRELQDQLQRTVEHYLRGADLPPDITSFRMLQNFVSAQSRYEVEPYDGAIVILRAKNIDFSFARGGRQLGWQRHVTGAIHVHDFSCSHLTMVVEPTVQQVAATMRHYLDGAQPWSLERESGEVASEPAPLGVGA